MVQHLCAGNKGPCKLSWIRCIRIRRHRKAHAAAVEVNLAGQIPVAVVLRIHISQHCLKKPHIRQILHWHPAGVKQYLQISDSGGEQVAVDDVHSVLHLDLIRKTAAFPFNILPLQHGDFFQVLLL